MKYMNTTVTFLKSSESLFLIKSSIAVFFAVKPNLWALLRNLSILSKNFRW